MPLTCVKMIALFLVMTTEGEDEILAATRNGMGIRFSEKMSVPWAEQLPA